MKFLNNMDPKDFLKNYWAQKPHVFRNVIEEPQSLVNVDDLIQMSQDDNYETRMISKDDQWRASNGPFNDSVFKDKSKNWTLIVHSLNLYFSQIKELESKVSFLPKWLFDDVMCTYSTKGSSVGAHIDNYSVFILQTSGRRKWSLQMNPNDEYQDGIDVKILKHFDADQEYILEPGDMIYIPPKVAHWGESLTESVSLSIGFKSIEEKEIIDMYALSLINQEELHNDFYQAPVSKSQESHPFLVTDEVIDSVYNKMIKNISQKDLFKKYFLKLLSSPKTVYEEDEITNEEFIENIELMPLYKDEYTRGAYYEQGQMNIFSVNTIEYVAPKDKSSSLINFIDQLASDEISKDTIYEHVDFFIRLYNQGSLYFSEETI